MCGWGEVDDDKIFVQIAAEERRWSAFLRIGNKLLQNIRTRRTRSEPPEMHIRQTCVGNVSLGSSSADPAVIKANTERMVTN